MPGHWQNGVWVDDSSGGVSGGYPTNGTPAQQKAWLIAHGFNPDTFGNNPTGLPPGFVVGRDGELLPPGTGNTAGHGIRMGDLFDIGGTVYRWNGRTITKASAKDTSTYDGHNSLDPSSETGFAGGGGVGSTANTYGGAGGSGGGGQRLASDDPRYWDLQYQQLYQQALNSGLDSESARRSALAGLIANRNNTAVDVANTSANIAKQAADYAANPRDAVAELIYRNQVGGTTPFGDVNNSAFGEYGKALAQKGADIFGPVNRDLQQARTYRDSIPPIEFLNPSPAVQNIIGGGGAPVSSPAPSAPPPSDILTQLTDRLKAMSPADQEAFRRYVTPASAARGHVWYSTGNVTGEPGFGQGFAGGGSLNFDGMFDGRDQPGYSPASSEGGSNLNIHERAVIVGESGHVYGTLGEKRPDGTVRAEQIVIKPLKSEVAKDKRLEDAHKAAVESQNQTMAAFAGGGSATATPADFMKQLSQQLARLGGQGGGTGAYGTPLPSLRLLAGAPANALAEDPVLSDYTAAGYSALGIDPRTVQATIDRYTPKGIVNNSPRVNYL